MIIPRFNKHNCHILRDLIWISRNFLRFLFAFPCQDMSASTVITKLKDIFILFGTPAYPRSYLMSRELKSFLHDLDGATSQSTAYNLESRQLNFFKWEIVYPDTT